MLNVKRKPTCNFLLLYTSFCTKADGASPFCPFLPHSWGPTCLTVIFPTRKTVKWLIQRREERRAEEDVQKFGRREAVGQGRRNLGFNSVSLKERTRQGASGFFAREYLKSAESSINTSSIFTFPLPTHTVWQLLLPGEEGGRYLEGGHMASPLCPAEDTWLASCRV